MELYLIWLLVGVGLVIVEVITGTFYLLMLGVAAFGAGVAAWLGQGFPVQIIVAAAVASAGCYGVHVWRAKNSKEQMTPIDAGQPAKFERWVDENGGLARVSYRGASWEARIEGGAAGASAVVDRTSAVVDGSGAVGGLEAGALLYIVATEGSSLRVSRQRPA